MPTACFTESTSARRNGLVSRSSTSSDGTVGLSAARSSSICAERRFSAAFPASTVSANLALAWVYSWAQNTRSEEHTSELQSLMRISYAVFCLKKKTNKYVNHTSTSNIYTTTPQYLHRLTQDPNK